MHGLGLGRWLRIVESDESRDREDSTSDVKMTQNRLTMTVVSKEHASDSLHDPAGSLGKEVRPRKRRCKSYESDTEALPEYELARLKRIKTNKEMLVSLGIENPLPKLHRRRCRKRPPAVPADDITHLVMKTVSTRSYPPLKRRMVTVNLGVSQFRQGIQVHVRPWLQNRKK